MDSIIIHPKSKEQASLFEQLAKALKVPFEKEKTEKSPYKPEFVKKIKQLEEDFEQGRFTKIELSDMKSNYLTTNAE